MQDKKSDLVRFILDSLCNYLNVKNKRMLASYFGENENKFYAWIRNGNIADTGLILAKHPEINMTWLKTGEGPMLRDDIPTANTILTGTNSIQAGRSIHGGSAQINIDGGQLSLDAEEVQLIKLLREVGGKMMLRKFIGDLEKLQEIIKNQI